MPLIKLELSDLPPRPSRRPGIMAAWRYLMGTHHSVSGLFDGLHVLRQAEQQARGKSAQGKLTHDQQDLLRAALVFTSGGLDACLKQLLRDALEDLVNGNRSAERGYKDQISRRLNDKVVGELREAILSRAPRRQLVTIYIAELTKPSLQGTDDVKKVRDALGITRQQLPDDRIDRLTSFFAARNEIVHEMDFVQSTGPGVSSRRNRGMTAVRDQCDEVLQLVASLIMVTDHNLRALRTKRRKVVRG